MYVRFLGRTRERLHECISTRTDALRVHKGVDVRNVMKHYEQRSPHWERSYRDGFTCVKFVDTFATSSTIPPGMYRAPHIK